MKIQGPLKNYPNLGLNENTSKYLAMKSEFLLKWILLTACTSFLRASVHPTFAFRVMVATKSNPFPFNRLID